MNSRGMQENIPPNTQDDDDGPPTMDYGKLIELVSQCRILYDMGSKDYKNTTLKDSCWQRIGQLMGQAAADCSARWLKLKDCYRREKNKRAAETKSGSGLTTRKGFAFYQQMTFIENCSNKRKSYTNVSTSVTPAPAKKSFHGHQNMPSYQSMSSSCLPDDALQTYPHLMIPTATFTTNTSSYDSTTLATGSLLTTSNASEIVASFFNSQSTISGMPALRSEPRTDPGVASSGSPTAPQTESVPLSKSSAALLSETVSVPTSNPNTAEPVSICETSCKPANSLTQPAMETASTVTFAMPEAYSQFIVRSTSPVQNTLTNVAKGYSGGPISTPPSLLTPDPSRTPTPTSNYQFSPSPSTSVCSSPGPASPMGSSCSFNLDTPRACFNKDSIRTKKVDPLEASFMSLSKAMQNKLQDPVRVETGQRLTSDQIFGNLIASELNNMTAEQKTTKKALILEILYQKD